MNTAHDSKLKVLVVEDDQDIMFGICRVLTQCNCDAVGADTPERAFEILSTTHVDVIFSDMRLSCHSSGEEILAEALKNYPQTKVVMMSATMDANRRQKLLSKGADECVQKPFFSDKCAKLLSILYSDDHLAA